MHMKMHWKLKSGIITGVVLTALLVFGIVDKLYCNSVPAHSAGGGGIVARMQINYRRIAEIYGTGEEMLEIADDVYETQLEQYHTAMTELAGDYGSNAPNVKAESIINAARQENRALTEKEAYEAENIIFATEYYIANMDWNKKMELAEDVMNPRWDPERIGKPLDEIDSVYDYDFDLLEQVEEKLEKVDRHRVLAVIFDRVTDGCNTNSEIYEEVYQFLFRIEMNHPKGLQAMHRNGQMVTDPLLLLELQEMRCGQIARLAVDLFAAGGYSGRLVQGDGHVWAEIWYDNKWRFLDADHNPGTPIWEHNKIMIDNDFPSTAELLSRPEKWAALFYEPYRYFQNVIDGEWMYYIKTAALAEEINQYYGWNFYSTITEPAIVPPEIEERYYDTPADTAA